jgi:hypothetical protein
MLYSAYGGHHLGTARMGTDSHTSVVDGDCKIHGVQNLFVASSATFPTSSQASALHALPPSVTPSVTPSAYRSRSNRPVDRNVPA